jgi:hypothetical protein
MLSCKAPFDDATSTEILPFNPGGAERLAPCAQPHALVRGRPGVVVELSVEYRGGRKHLPIVALRLIA